ncbi:DUF6624 domain-containing protein [Pseudoxanthomonas mexicana]|uniref:DUF6624 domain-containing protein n=1 Tax=Pseudoxanthomonas mexicana TaxID=128785 RepID=UPI00398A7470
MKSIIITTMLMVALGATMAAETSTTLAQELLLLREEDQALRSRQPKDDAEWKEMLSIAAAQTARIKSFVEKHGWPTRELVGAEASDAAWLLVQHADSDREFQRYALTLIEPLVSTGEVRGANYAYLWDRVHLPQRYGTQGECRDDGSFIPHPIEDSENVDERRNKLGMSNLSEYIAFASQRCASRG